ncbi:hypothetical protein FGADI_3911 [Fusarium gaditjirri]|uniref:Uncharacterized protein n=1 Tax=Fusarium gaditjirri TaxID=282569 RepID=A0A8H4TEE9_9HYPO|nr:hypothetical protein FGADI_3911 [Fusarium gaditjirri]
MLGILPQRPSRDVPQLARLNHVPRLLGDFRLCKLISPPSGLPSERLETVQLISGHLTPRVCHARQDFNLNRQDAQPPPDSIDATGIAFLDNRKLKPILIYPNSELGIFRTHQRPLSLIMSRNSPNASIWRQRLLDGSSGSISFCFRFWSWIEQH